MSWNYIDQARQEFLQACGGDESSWDDSTLLLDLFALLVISKGTTCTSEDVRHAWAIRDDREQQRRAVLAPEFDARCAAETRDSIRTAAAELVTSGNPPTALRLLSTSHVGPTTVGPS